MIIVVSPAKALDFESPWATQKSSKPSLLKKSEELVGVLSQKSPDQLGSLMSLSDSLAELNFERRKVSLSIKLLEELQNKEAVSKFSSPLSGKNLPFSSLSDQLDDKKKDKK